MAPRRQPSSSSRDHSRRGQLRSRLFAAGALGLTSLGATWPSCSSLPPCFDDSATYRVQLLERLPESDCDPSLKLDWVFEMRPTTVDGEANQTCTAASLSFNPSPPGTTVDRIYGSSNRLRSAMQPAGTISVSITDMPPSCEATISLSAFIPTTAETTDTAILSGDLVWQVHHRNLTSNCVDPVPQYASCTDYYTSITEKL